MQLVADCRSEGVLLRVAGELILDLGAGTASSQIAWRGEAATRSPSRRIRCSRATCDGDLPESLICTCFMMR